MQRPRASWGAPEYVARFASRPQTRCSLRLAASSTRFITRIVLLIGKSFHRSHFGSRYKLGCCGHAGLFVNGSSQPRQYKLPSRRKNFAPTRYPLPPAGHGRQREHCGITACVQASSRAAERGPAEGAARQHASRVKELRRGAAALPHWLGADFSQPDT